MGPGIVPASNAQWVTSMDRDSFRNSLLDYTTADILNTPIQRGGVLPLTRYPGRTEFDLSSGITGAVADAFTAPSRAYSGDMSEADMVPEAMNLAGLLTLGGYMSPKPANALGAGGGGIRAFHGSPHDFDRFDMSKIGTGEGAQAYGRGLYFAENEGVARSYRDNLSKTQTSMIDNSHPLQSDHARLALLNSGNDIDAAIAAVSKMPGKDDVLSELVSARDAVKASQPPGHMYEVRINADPQSFVDYDAPLGQQSDTVRRALDDAGLMPYTVVDQAGNRIDFSRGMPKSEAEKYATAKGGRAIPKEDADFDAVQKAQMMLGRGDAAQADIATALLDSGIPGIRYLDQGSRGAGHGSRNYVVFDDALIEIMRKYGLLGPVAAGTIAGALSDDGPIY